MADGIRILSENLSGETVHIIFTADTGSTITDFGVVTIPADLITDYFYGTYSISAQTYKAIYTYVIGQPTPTPSPTPTPTETPNVTPTPTTTPIPVTGYGYNLVVLPFNYPTSGNTIMTDQSISGIGTTNPNLMTTGNNGIYFNSLDVGGIDRTSYFSSFTGQSVTITMSQTGSTSIYSGSTNAFQSWVNAGNTGFNFGYGIAQQGYSSGTTVLIQSAPTPWVTGQTVYVSVVVNGAEVTPTPQPTNTSTPTVTPSITVSVTPSVTPDVTPTMTPTSTSTSQNLLIDDLGNYIITDNNDFLVMSTGPV